MHDTYNLERWQRPHLRAAPSLGGLARSLMYHNAANLHKPVGDYNGNRYETFTKAGTNRTLDLRRHHDLPNESLSSTVCLSYLNG